MDLEILKYDYFTQFKDIVKESPLDTINKLEIIEIPVDYFQFYNSVSSVYSSKIEGENIDFDSFYKYKFLKVKYKPDYTKKADDLFSAYEFIYKNKLSLKNVLKTHSIISSNLLPKSQQGFIRTNPMFVINSEDKIEYVAADSRIVKQELDRLFHDISQLQDTKLDAFEILYFASYIHLVFVKIHPFQDGNGRTARLIEKWFLIDKLGDIATSIQLEKNYYTKLHDYYDNIKKLGVEYEKLNYDNCLDFLLMTVKGLKEQK